DHQRNVFTVALGDADALGEERLLMVTEYLLAREIDLAATWSSESRGEDDYIILSCVGTLQHPPQLQQGVVVANRDQCAIWAHADSFTLDALFMEQLEVLLHLLFGVLELLCIRVFGDGEDYEERGGEDHSADGRYLLGREIHQRGGEQHHEYRKQSKGDFFPKNPQVRGNLPATFAFVLETQHQHGEAVEGEAPYHAKRMSPTENVHIAAAEQDGDDLQANDQVHDAVARAVLALRFTEPVG